MNPVKSFFKFGVALLSLLIAAVTGFAQGIDSQHVARQQSADDLYFDAVKAHILGDDTLSAVLLKKVIAARPNEPAPYYDLSRQELKANNSEKAAEYIRKAIALDNKNKWYHEQYANVLTLRSEYVAAAEEYANLAKTEKLNDQYLERSALLYQRAGKYREALAQLETLRKQNSDEDVMLQEQQIYLKMNEVEKAADISRELIREHPKESRYYSMLIHIYEDNKQADKAKQAREEMTKKFPGDPSLQIDMATQAFKRGDTALYRDYVRKAVTNKELDAESQLSLLQSYLGDPPFDAMKRKDALSLAQEIATQHPENVNAISTYGLLLSMNDRTEDAAIQYKKAVGLKKGDFGLWERLLQNYTDRQTADSLIRWSEKAARLFPNQATVHYLNGLGYYNKKDYPQAIKAIRRAVDLEPEEKAEELSSIYTVLGDIYNSTKEYKLSDSSYNTALRLNPHNATVLNNYAYYLSVRNTRLDDAAKMSLESLKIRPGEATFLDTYGWILYQQGKYHEALDYIQKAISGNGVDTDPTLYEHLGAIQYKLGNKDAAVEAWRKAKERGSDNIIIDKMISERKLYE
jgi:tetratricopeptide (TPR) repeat protein